MPVPSAMVARFFHFLANRHFADAERELERIKEKMHKSEWNRGYYRALRGMLIKQRSESYKYSFLSGLNLNDKEALKKYKKEFQTHVKSELHEDFDRGFFSAWAEFMRLMSKLAVKNPVKSDREDKSQRRIESFLKEEDLARV